VAGRVRILLDTHVLLWALVEPKKLSKKALRIIENPSSLLHVSPVSAWEIGLKVHLGKLKVPTDVSSRFEACVARLSAVELSITIQHALAAARFPAAHRDPFDRMLAAQASVDQLSLITVDEAFADFPVETIW
jgi:PIN domain nuclease of toxin-antitoxin system